MFIVNFYGEKKKQQINTQHFWYMVEKKFSKENICKKETFQAETSLTRLFFFSRESFSIVQQEYKVLMDK